MKLILRDISIISMLILSLIFLWFFNDLIFAGGEEGIPFYDLGKTLQLVSFAWQDTSAGYANQIIINRMPYFSFLNSFTFLPNYLIQGLHFAIIMLTGTISFYFLIHKTIFEGYIDKFASSLFKYVPLTAVIFYLLNPFSMTQIWGRGLYMQFFPFALFPLFLLMFILGIRYRNFIFGVAGLMASILFAGAFGNPSYIFSFWIILFIYLVFYIYRNRKRNLIFFAIFYFLFLLIGWFFVNMWWITSFLNVSQNQLSTALNNTEANLATVRGISKDYTFFSLIRLIHEGYFFRGLKYGESYVSIIFTLISWLVPIISLFSVVIFKKNKSFLFFSLLFLFSLFICLGSNFPSGILFDFIFTHFPAFQAFRNPFEKFGVVLTLAYAPFFALGLVVFSLKLSEFFRRNSYKFIIYFFCMFIFFGVYLWPIWTGQFAGGLVFNPWVRVPNYYKSLNSWLNLQPNDGRIIHFPINPGDGIKYNWEHSYQGIEPSEYIFDRPAIGKNGQLIKPYYNVLLERFNKFEPLTYGPDPDLTNSEFKSNNLSDELSKLNVKYIILHYDIDTSIGKFGESEPVADYLKNQENIKQVQSFDKLDVYEVITPGNVKLIYSPTKDLTYKKINPTLYEVDVVGSSGTYTLYFLENFDDGWEASIDNQIITSKIKVFSYANGWEINNEGTYKIIIKYKPQDFIDSGIKVTKYSILSLILFCLFIILLKGVGLFSKKRKSSEKGY